MAAPAQKWKAKGIELALWENSYGDTYTLTKSYKSKKTGEWVKESIKLYPNELELVGEVMAKGVAYSLGAPTAEEQYLGQVPVAAPIVVQDFDDDSIPF